METINLPKEEKLNLQHIKYLFTKGTSKIIYVYESDGFYHYPSNNDIIDNIGVNVELYVVSNDNIKLNDYYLNGGKTVDHGVSLADTERLVSIANEMGGEKVVLTTDNLEGIPQFSEKLIDLAIKQLNSK